MTVDATSSSEEFLCGLLNSLIFMLIGAAFVLGRRSFVPSCANASFSAACTWHRLWKQQRCRLLLSWPWSADRSSCKVAATSSALGSARSTVVPEQEQLAAEVALLLKQGRVLAALELLQQLRTARMHDSPKWQPGPSCFRMVLLRLACSPTKPEILERVTQEMSLLSLPLDPISQASCVRCLCRGEYADVDKAYSAYTSMLAAGASADLHTVECLAEACLRTHRHDIIKPLILGLDEHGLEPSATLFAALITSCAATGAIACGMAAFEQLRAHFPTDLRAVQLGYSSVINMCVQNQEVDRALSFLEESRQLSKERGFAPALLEARLLPPLLAAAVQADRAEQARDLAHQAHCISSTAFVQCPREGREFQASLKGLCKLLQKRHMSRELMEQVSAILDAPSSSDCQDSAASLGCSSKPKGVSTGNDKRRFSSAFRIMRSASQLLGVSRFSA